MFKHQFETENKTKVGSESSVLSPETAVLPANPVHQWGQAVETQAGNLQRATNGRLSRASNTLLKLQQSYGNQHVGRVLNQTMVVQPKLMLGDVDTPHEREADQLAQEAAQGEIRTSPTAVYGGGAAVSPQTESAINQARGTGQPIPDTTRAQMEQNFGADFSGVRVHTDERAHSLNQTLQARAFTTGQDIFFRRGEYNPGSSSGQSLLAHEMTHVVQQNGGLTAPIQRDDFTQTEDDSELKYPVSFGDISESLGVGYYRLTKQKTLRKSNSKFSTSLGTLAKGRLVTVLSQPSKGDKEWRSWAQVKAKVGGDTGKVETGYINTESGLKDASGLIKHDKPNAGTDKEGVIMPGTPTVADIEQHMFGDCFLLAGMMALTQRDPGYVSRPGGLFVEDPAKSHDEITVRLFHMIPKYVTDVTSEDDFREDKIKVKNTVLIITDDLASTDSEVYKKGAVGSRGAQPWPAIVEKAFKIWPGKFRKDSLGGGLAETGLASLIGRPVDTDSAGVSSSEILPKMTERDPITKAKGKKDKEYKKLYDTIKKEIAESNQARFKKSLKQSVKDKRMITAATKDSVPEEWKEQNPGQEGALGMADESTWGGIVFGHAYQVVSADDTHVTLQNPWQKFARVRGRIRNTQAQSVLTWAEFFMVVDKIAVARKREV